MEDDILIEEELGSHLEVLKSLIGRIEAHLMSSDVKVTFTEYLRLLQFFQESGGEQPAVLKVEWVSPASTDISR